MTRFRTKRGLKKCDCQMILTILQSFHLALYEQLSTKTGTDCPFLKKGENGQSGDVICGRLADKQADTTDDAMLQNEWTGRAGSWWGEEGPEEGPEEGATCCFPGCHGHAGCIFETPPTPFLLSFLPFSSVFHLLLITHLVQKNRNFLYAYFGTGTP